MEEEDEVEEEGEEKEEEKTQKEPPNIDVHRGSSSAFLFDPQDISEGLTNPAFSCDDSQPTSRSRNSNQWRKPIKSPRWACLSRDRPYGYCRSLSSSMENMAFAGAPLSPTRGSFPSLNESMNNESLLGRRGLKNNTSLRCSRSQGMITHGFENQVNLWTLMV